MRSHEPLPGDRAGAPAERRRPEVSSRPADPIVLAQLLTLERIADNLFRTVVVVGAAPAPVYGGQVAAQALRAAAATVPADRYPHSLYGYFLSRGDASRQLQLTVDREHDDDCCSHRRVTAAQDRAVIFVMSASFREPDSDQAYQGHQIPPVAAPDELPDWRLLTRMRGVDMRVPGQLAPGQRWPSRVWLRARHPLPDDITQACALTYVSDMFDGLQRVPGNFPPRTLTSIDHAVRIYRKIALDDWVLMDLQPESVHGGRGLYTGQIFARDGGLVASIAQETLLRRQPSRAEPLAPPGLSRA
jgi:acyl-CoA thioesterase-2